MKQIKNAMISFSFDNWKLNSMIINQGYNLWLYYIIEKMNSGWYEYKLTVELDDGSQIQTHDSEC